MLGHHLQENHPNILKRIYTRADRGNGPLGLNSAEVVSVFLEEVAEGNIDFKGENKTGFAGLVGRMFGDGIAKASNTDFEFDFAGEKDVINFLVGMGKRIKNGTLTKADIKDIKKSEIFSRPTIKETSGAASFSKSIYDDKTLFTPEDLVQIIKAPSSKPSEKAGANNALTNQFDLLALDALNYNTQKGDIAREDVVSAAREYLPGIIERFNPKTAKFSTMVYSNMNPKQAVIYEEAKNLFYGETTSTDTKEARQVPDTTTELDQTLSEDKVTKVNVLQTGKIASKQDDIIKATNEKGTFREVIDNNEGKVGSIIFGIPENKIANREDNITVEDTFFDNEGNELSKADLRAGKKGIPQRSEAKSIQDYYF